MTMNIRPTHCPRCRNPLPQGGNSSHPTVAGADLEFGRFRVLLRRRQLLADGVPVELGTRAFNLLLVLLEADGTLVTKEELISRVWPSVMVSEENLKFQVHALRKAFGANRDLILTEFGRGYRFTGMLRTNIVLEPCRPMRSKQRSGPIFFLPSCRHSLQCSVNSTQCTTGEGFTVSTQ